MLSTYYKLHLIENKKNMERWKMGWMGAYRLLLFNNLKKKELSGQTCESPLKWLNSQAHQMKR
jgi:hypothetical protein